MMDLLLKYPYAGYDWTFLTLHPYISSTMIFLNVTLPWDFQILHTKHDFKMEYIELCPEKKWDWHGIAVIKLWNMVRKYPNAGWNWSYILNFKPYDWDILVKHAPDNIWNNLTNEIPMKYIDCKQDWNYTILSNRKDLNFKLVATNPDKNWDWLVLSKHLKLNWYIVAAYPHKPWNWKVLSCRIDILWKITAYEHLINRWNWSKLNPPDYFAKEHWMLNWKKRHVYRRERASIIIQKWWLEFYYNPNHEICQQRLIREFNELSNS